MILTATKELLFRKKSISFLALSLIGSFLIGLNAADYTLIHSQGESGREYTDKGLQGTHEQTQVVYLTTNATINLTPPAKTSRYAYQRWFSLADETAGKPTNLTFANSTTNTIRNYTTDKGQVVICTNENANNALTSPTYKFTGTAEIIACEQTNYTDYSVNTTAKSITEPTLAQRILFDIRPASQMAAEVDKCKSTTAPNQYTGKYLEEYTLMAPVGATLNIGPAYQFSNGADYPNYYYGETSPQKLTTWRWYVDGTQGQLGTPANYQFITVNAPQTPGTKTYSLVARTGSQRYPTYYYIAKFTIQFVEPTKYGPAAAPTEANQLADLDLLYEERFNANPSGTTTPTYSSVPLKWKESTYGFYYSTLRNKRLKYDKASGTYDPYWSDYALLSSTNALSPDWFVRNMYNHGAKGTAEDAKDGYFLYVDGAPEPGVCFTIDVEADLCPGSVMYFSAYFAAVQSSGAQPQFDFALSGRKNGKTEAILTYATGLITTTGKWQRIVVPVELKQEYDSYHLIITNKANTSGGNDFIFDDFQIFASKPPVYSLQASNPVCVDPTGDELVTYLRVTLDDQNLADVENLYYQWTDDNGTTIDMDYYNKQQSSSDAYGKVPIPDGAIPQDLIYASETDFDAYASQDGHTPSIGFVEKNGTWVLYIANKANLVPDKYYTGYVATDPSQLRSTACGLQTVLEVEGSMYMTVNRERIRNGTTIDHCGNRLLSFAVERLYITGDAAGVTKKKVTCNADFLWGTATYVDNNFIIYGASFADIQAAIEAERRGIASNEQNKLLKDLRAARLLTSNINRMDVYLSADMDLRLLMFTAFPIAGTGVILDDDGNPTTETVSICTNPIEGEVLLPDIDLEAIRIGTKDDYEEMQTLLPNFVTSRPRIIRVSNQQRLTGQLTIPIFCNFAGDKSFNFLPAELYATTDPNATAGTTTLTLQETQVSKDDSEITLLGIDQLRPGYTYSFVLHEYDFDQTNCLQAETVFQLAMVPDRVVWSPQNGSTAWNDDDNWKTTDGTNAFCPTEETDVILPAAENTIPTPVLTADETQRAGVLMETEAAKYISYDINFTPFVCRNLYLPSGATLLNQHYLKINGTAVVDMPVPTNKWVLCSMPIAAGVSGDFYAPASGESSDVFSVKTITQNAGTRAADRLDNRVWQSLYNKSMINYGEKDVPIISSSWTEPLNALNTPYPPGMGVALWIECSNGAASLDFRLPKSDTQYRWFDEQGIWKTAPIVSVARDMQQYGRPAYQYTEAEGGMTISLTNYDASGNLFLFGNPTWAYIDMEKLLQGNSHLQTAYYVLTEGTQELTACVKDISSDAGLYRYLPPMRGILLQTNSPAQTTSITITPDMLCNKPIQASRPAPRMAPTATDKELLYITVSANDDNYGGIFTSRAVVCTEVMASDTKQQNEDATFLLLDEWKTPFGVFTMSEDNYPLTINTQSHQDIIPLGIYAQHPIGKMSISFEGNNLDEWELGDTQSGTYTPLTSNMLLPFYAPTNGECRFCLRRTKPSDINTRSELTNDDIRFLSGVGEISVLAKSHIKSLAIYDILGRLIMEMQPQDYEVHYPLPAGMYMVKIITTNGATASEVFVY